MTTTRTTAGQHRHRSPAPRTTERTPMTTPASPTPAPLIDAPKRRNRLVIAIVGIVVVLAVVTVGGSLAARKLAEREAVNDAVNLTDVFAETVIRPALTDRLAAGQPAARQTFADLVHAHVIGPSVVHVKLWTPAGKVVYADEAGLVGLPDEQDAVRADPGVRRADRAHAAGRQLERQPTFLDDHIVVAQRLPLLEVHGA